MTTSTFILVPGAGGDPLYWDLVVPLLREAGHEAVAVRLPAGEDGAGLAAYADAIAAAMGDRSDVVLVAQSMGAFSAPDGRRGARRRGADRARRADDPRARRDPRDVLGRRAGRTPRSAPSRSRRAATRTRRSIWTRCSSTTCPPTSRRGCSRRATRATRASSSTDPWPLDAWPDIPTTVIAGARDRLLPLPFMRGLARDRLGLDELTVIDAGHLPALAAPRSSRERSCRDDRSRRLRRQRLRPQQGLLRARARAARHHARDGAMGRAAGFGEGRKPFFWLEDGRSVVTEVHVAFDGPRPRDRRRVPRRRARGRRDRQRRARACARSTTRPTTAPTCSTPTATTSRPSATSRPEPRRSRLERPVFGSTRQRGERDHEDEEQTRNNAEGTIDKIAGRVLEAVGKVTGKRSTKAKGKAARGRGTARSTKGRAKGAKR